MGLRAQPQPICHGDDGPVGHRAEGGAEKGDTGGIRPDGCHLLGGGLAGGQVEVGGSVGFLLGGGGVHPPVGEGGVVVSARVDHAVLDVVVGQILVVAAAEGELKDLHARESAVGQQLAHAGEQLAQVLGNDGQLAKGSFQRIEKILLLVSCVFVTYIVAAFMAGPNWGEVAVDLVVPNIQNDPSYVSLVVATIGTTIAPWMIFLAQNNVVDKNAGEDDIVLQRIDTVSGSLAADVIAGFIIITTGTVLFPAGIQISDAADAARALEPIAGQWSTVLFASGLVAASFLAACVLPGVTSSAICEAFGWERGADRSWDEAPVYRGIITAIIGISAVLVLMPGVDLFQIMMTSQVINGVLLPVVLVFQVVIAADRHIMGTNRNGRVWNVLTWATIGVITVLTVVMFVLQAMGYSA